MSAHFAIIILALSCSTMWAELTVVVSPPVVVGQKAIVSLALTNNLAEPIKSARAICFLLDRQGAMVGESTRWVLGGTKNQQALSPKSGTTFNFVITCPQPFSQTNLMAKLDFSRIVLESGRLLDTRKEVEIQNIK